MSISLVTSKDNSAKSILGEGFLNSETYKKYNGEQKDLKPPLIVNNLEDKNIAVLICWSGFCCLSSSKQVRVSNIKMKICKEGDYYRDVVYFTINGKTILIKNTDLTRSSKDYSHLLLTPYTKNNGYTVYGNHGFKHPHTVNFYADLAKEACRSIVIDFALSFI
jgi:hypothetical protein